MANDSLYPGSLVLYKNRPGRILQVGEKKVELEIEGGQRLSVRPKDVTLLHPGPLDSLAALRPPAGDVQTAWELLAGESASLAELAELIYGRYTPAAAWATWDLVADGLYFSGSPERIAAHSPEAVAREQAARQARAAEERAWAAFLAGIAADHYRPEDRPYLEEVAALAVGRASHSRVLRALNQEESQENAHDFLLKVGYWTPAVNPYPERAGLPVAPPAVALPTLPAEERRDLTHLLALAIDDEGNRDPDDALSLDGGRLWVHIADVAALVPPDSPADLEAQARGANLYLPEGTVPILPAEATPRLALGLDEVSPALSFGLALGPEGEIGELEITPSWVRVTRLSYEEAEGRLDEPLLAGLLRLAQRYQARRLGNGAIEIGLPEVKIRVIDEEVVIRPLPPLRSRDLVREAMLMAGEAVARLALAQNIPLPYTIQNPPFENLDFGLPILDSPPNPKFKIENPKSNHPLSPSQGFALRRTLKPSQQVTAPGPHAGLGMELYVQCTSPLRRYLDLVAHQQLRAYLRGAPLLDSQAILARIGAADAVTGSVRWAERRANEHWTLVYLLQHPGWQGEGIIVDRRGNQDVVLIPELGLETQVYQSQVRPLDSRIRVGLKKVWLAYLEAHFQYLNQ
ncbi:MAG: RNB domain-containing ribonuclease [Chloroflexi bacterium]|nr:RNB domain-containing ribonuclease [Chloroflexota bacterium]MCI0577363.1 RNB domain-containing ribonuclease [Chloroflexota bacterium]MCI0647050.1 RNB domain-containing ribonuclease [Chloroflexota bacterium]MCI0731537.1 RNB domain-containing ribonuclease [Chloroflexota bacterium]